MLESLSFGGLDDATLDHVPLSEVDEHARKRFGEASTLKIVRATEPTKPAPVMTTDRAYSIGFWHGTLITAALSSLFVLLLLIHR